jgi:hypothetical protein
MDRLKTARNVAIILLIAAAVDLLPAGARATNTLSATLEVAFSVAFAYLGVRLYREHRVGIYGLGERYRLLFYGALAAAVITVEARTRMWQSGLGEFLWFVLIGAVVYALLSVYRFSRRY